MTQQADHSHIMTISCSPKWSSKCYIFAVAKNVSQLLAFAACRFLWSVTPLQRCTTAPPRHCWRSRFANHSSNRWQSLTQLTCGCGCSHNHRLRALWVYFDTTSNYAAAAYVCVCVCGWLTSLLNSICQTITTRRCSHVQHGQLHLELVSKATATATTWLLLFD